MRPERSTLGVRPEGTAFGVGPESAPRIIPRPVSTESLLALSASTPHPILARIFAARGINRPAQLDCALSGLHPPAELRGAEAMARILADAIAAGQRLLIVADYDSDGATACAVGLRGLRACGASVDYLVPNRFEYGYGLTPEIVRLAATRAPDMLITVDNGIASVEGVEEARRLGLGVLITDHHLPGAALPDALCIVNPNQPGCGFPSKHIAGVGVMFYVLLALRAELRARGAFASRPEPNLAKLLDLVALGTVADVVRLDDNNRILVSQGLGRIGQGRACAGIQALMQVAGRNARQASVYDLGFVIGPRLNAAGRLSDMTLGIECLTTDDPARALAIAQELDALNRERREIEAGMLDQALSSECDVCPVENPLGGLSAEYSKFITGYSICLFDPAWHQGVIGILAGRLKERFHRPVIVFAPGSGDELKGSGRAIAGLHLRDALDLVSKRHPRLIKKFGGHAAAAGLTIGAAGFPAFSEAFEEVARGLLTPADLTRIIETDGELAPEQMTLELARLLDAQVWGQGFPPPTFSGCFQVVQQRVVGEKHLKLRLQLHPKGTSCGAQDRTFDAMLFSYNQPLPTRILAVYRLKANEYNGSVSLQLTIDHWQDAPE